MEKAGRATMCAWSPPPRGSGNALLKSGHAPKDSNLSSGLNVLEVLREILLEYDVAAQQFAASVSLSGQQEGGIVLQEANGRRGQFQSNSKRLGCYERTAIFSVISGSDSALYVGYTCMTSRLPHWTFAYAAANHELTPRKLWQYIRLCSSRPNRFADKSHCAVLICAELDCYSYG